MSDFVLNCAECGCDTPDRFAVSDALISLDRIVAGLSAPVREGSAEDVDPDGFRSMLSESLAEIHDRIARALGLGDPS